MTAKASFESAVALVTGAASGIGEALCRQLSVQGAHLVCADIDFDNAARVAGSLPNARAIELDVRNREQWQRTVADILATEGRIDYLFNNAGICVIGNVLSMSHEHWGSLIDVNIKGVCNGIKVCYPVMVRQGSGHIVNTASASGLFPTPGFTAYGMTKHAVAGVSQSLRVEAARYGVKVSAACPGMINSNMAENAQILGASARIKEQQPDIANKLPSTDYCARKIIKGVRKNKAIIPVTAAAHIAWRLFRLSPGLLNGLSRQMAKQLAPVE